MYNSMVMKHWSDSADLVMESLDRQLFGALLSPPSMRCLYYFLVLSLEFITSCMWLEDSICLFPERDFPSNSEILNRNVGTGYIALYYRQIYLYKQEGCRLAPTV